MQSPARVGGTTCEHHVNPLGLDERTPRFSWIMEDPRRGARASAHEIEVASRDSFDAASVIWRTGERPGPSSVLVPYAGPALRPRTRYHWRVRISDQEEKWSPWSETAWFETGFLDEPWSASWIGAADVRAEERGPGPLLRASFVSERRPTTARLYSAARGAMVLSVNGRRVSADCLSPGWTDYDARTHYVTHDVTDLVVQGANALGVMLGDGWYAGRIASMRDWLPRYGARPQFIGELHLTYDDGTIVVVVSDGTWRWSAGPVLTADIYDGEVYDARLEQIDWADAAFDDSRWEPVAVVGPAACRWDGTTAEDDPQGGAAWARAYADERAVGRPTAALASVAAGVPRLVSRPMPPLRATAELSAQSVSEPEPGRYVFDLGQNIVGWARIAVQGRTGQTVTIRYAEMRNPDGTLYVANLRRARATDEYTFAADGTAAWEPAFTYHGFRYVELSGLAARPASEAVTGIVVETLLHRTGTFTCSSALVNRLHENVDWTARGNYFEAPTDCPQRDERYGWLGDGQFFAPTAAFLRNTAPFLAKWVDDIADGQTPAGEVPSVAPAVRYTHTGGPAWSDAFVVCPWLIWQRYGDLRVAERHLPGLLRFIEATRAASRGLIVADEFFTPKPPLGLAGGYGDWLATDAPEGSTVGATPKDVVGTAYFAHSTRLVARLAEAAGRATDALSLRDLHRRIVAAFRRVLVSESGRVMGDTVTAYVLALSFDLLEEADRPAGVDRLVRILERKGYHTTSGIVGTPLLCPVLSRFGRSDVAYRLLMEQEYPSWLYMVNQGATTIWERWSSYRHDKGFGPVGMNSFNHFALGSIGAWLHATVGGIDVDCTGGSDGLPAIRIAPRPGFGLTSAKATLASPFGMVRSAWRIDGATVTLDLTIPANTTAAVDLPVAPGQVRVSGDKRPTGRASSGTLESGSWTITWNQTHPQSGGKQ